MVNEDNIPTGKPVFDDRTERNLGSLLPKAERAARLFLAKVRGLGFDARIISGTRSYAEQQALYDQAHDHKDNDGDGRVDESDEKVTKAPPGYSNHNFSVGFDVGIFKGNDYLKESPLYREISKYAEDFDLEWGGNWKFVDEPHYQLKHKYTMAQARYLKEKGEWDELFA